ncbi:MAG: mismatch-specific DNA-glycosylase [Pseudonocardiaceae bacterium]
MKPADLAAARDRTIPDVLPGPADPPLRVLFCGINPGLVSAATGHHFARPGNRFWPVLHGSGFTPRRLRPDEQDLLPSLGLGITNIAPRATARADELSTAELVSGGDRLRDLVRDLRPSALGVVGITAYRVAFAIPRAIVGPQPPVDYHNLSPERSNPTADYCNLSPERPPVDGATLVWALPNPSGLNAHWSLAAMVAEFVRFRLAAAAPPDAPDVSG